MHSGSKRSRSPGSSSDSDFSSASSREAHLHVHRRREHTARARLEALADFECAATTALAEPELRQKIIDIVDVLELTLTFDDELIDIIQATYADICDSINLALEELNLPEILFHGLKEINGEPVDLPADELDRARKVYLAHVAKFGSVPSPDNDSDSEAFASTASSGSGTPSSAAEFVDIVLTPAPRRKDSADDCDSIALSLANTLFSCLEKLSRPKGRVFAAAIAPGRTGHISPLLMRRALEALFDPATMHILHKANSTDLDLYSKMLAAAAIAYLRNVEQTNLFSDFSAATPKTESCSFFLTPPDDLFDAFTRPTLPRDSISSEATSVSLKQPTPGRRSVTVAQTAPALPLPLLALTVGRNITSPAAVLLASPLPGGFSVPR